MERSRSLDGATQEVLKRESFEGKFDVKDFVGSFSEKLIAQSKHDSGPFDPKPFIQSFESAVGRLIALRNDAQTKTEQMEKGVRVAEREYSKKMAELNRGFEAVGTSFSGMESRMSEVGRTAIRIGEQLESVHLERQRAQAAYDLIDYYNQFSKDDTTRIDTLRKDGKEGRRKVALLLRRLSTVAKEVDLPNAEKTRENIDKYCEKFEKDMLYLFDRCYRKGDPKMMHHCAQTLLDFNGGASCVQVYVNQHDFFINRVRRNTQSNDKVLWDALPDPNVTPPKTESALHELLQEIRTTVDQEAQIVQAVFPNPPFVMQVFLQRVFAQSIQQIMEQLLNSAAGISELAFLRVLQLAHSQTSLLVDDLKGYEVQAILPRSPIGGPDFTRTFAAPHVPGASTATAISTMLETAMEELFVPYTEASRYLEKEQKSLGELYSRSLSVFTRYHERVNRAKSSMFDRVMNQVNAATTGSSGTSAMAAAALMRFGVSTDRGQDKPGEEPLRDEDGVLSVDLAETMLKWHAEAIGRCVELSSATDVPKHAFALFKTLADFISNAYMEIAMETAVARLETADHSKTEPGLQALSLLHSVDLITHLWQQYVNVALIPLASSSVTIRREMVIFNNQTVSKVEGAANGLSQHLTDALVAWMTAQLAKQKKTDFKPRNDDESFSRIKTEPCAAICDMLDRVGAEAKQNLSGKNLEVFLTEIGVAFHRLFPVNATGGLMLAKDLKYYEDSIDAFGVPALKERFEFIRQLGQIFLVRPEVLKSFIQENYLGRIEPTLLRPYFAQRSDWGQFEKGFDGGDGEGTNGDGTKDRTGRDRLGMGRLSVLMKDLEGFRLGDSMSGMSIPSVNMPTLPTGIGLTGGFASGLSFSTRAFGRSSSEAPNAVT
ncbi:exocyst complex component Sec10 [Vararia minispora EC-137]|uniref:Exocyst complex component Sec10 n=1 Tax=Vararia minispora EC-137 TaxID=1314806 RepID=A0ACB8QFZ1_9AGAM|nr:exocyst complex component Sec10 [Vararia minispora EC-137]